MLSASSRTEYRRMPRSESRCPAAESSTRSRPSRMCSVPMYGCRSALGLLLGVRQNALRLLAERDLDRRGDLLAGRSLLLELGLEEIDGDVRAREQLTRDLLAFLQEAEEDVLRADDLAAGLARFVAGEEENALGLLGELLEHGGRLQVLPSRPWTASGHGPGRGVPVHRPEEIQTILREVGLRKGLHDFITRLREGFVVRRNDAGHADDALLSVRSQFEDRSPRCRGSRFPVGSSARTHAKGRCTSARAIATPLLLASREAARGCG